MSLIHPLTEKRIWGRLKLLWPAKTNFWPPTMRITVVLSPTYRKSFRSLSMAMPRMQSHSLTCLARGSYALMSFFSVWSSLFKEIVSRSASCSSKSLTWTTTAYLTLQSLMASSTCRRTETWRPMLGQTVLVICKSPTSTMKMRWTTTFTEGMVHTTNGPFTLVKFSSYPSSQALSAIGLICVNEARKWAPRRTQLEPSLIKRRVMLRDSLESSSFYQPSLQGKASLFYRTTLRLMGRKETWLSNSRPCRYAVEVSGLTLAYLTSSNVSTRRTKWTWHGMARKLSHRNQQLLAWTPKR